MYRREYPDVPGLFDARFSEYNQPSLVREFQKTWLVSLIGLIMLATGSGILFWNEGRAVRTMKRGGEKGNWGARGRRNGLR